MLLPLFLVGGVWLYAVFIDYRTGDQEKLVRDILIVFLMAVVTFLLVNYPHA